MKRRYKLPIKGTVMERKPLAGAEDDPICVIPFSDLVPKKEIIDAETKEKILTSELGGFSLVCLNYDIEEEWCEVEIEASNAFHDWLLNLIPQLKDIAKVKGWKLDKTELEKTKEVRKL